jgi:hypothetical protein
MAFSMILLAALCIAMSVIAFPSVREAILQPAIDVLMQTDFSSTTITGI